MTARFNNLFGVSKILELDLLGRRGIKSKNKDRVTLITGYEGTGKSNLMLHMFEIWLKLIGENNQKEYIKYIGDNQKTFITGLTKSPKYFMVVHDEAAKDLYGRSAMSSFSKDLNVAYQIIRGANLHTVLIIPSILDLDSFFRKRRVTQMYHVYSEGKVAYFTKSRIRKLLPRLSNASKYNEDPNVMDMGVAPLFTDTFPLYEGIYLNDYLSQKNSNIEQVREELYKKYVIGEETDKKVPIFKQIQPEIIKLKDQYPKMTNGELAKRLYTSRNAITQAMRDLKKNNKI